MSKAHGRRDKKKHLQPGDLLLAEFGALEQRFNGEEVEVAQLDLVQDLDEGFFSTSYELIHELTLINNFVAGKMKRYVDLLSRMHAQYAHVLENSMIINTKIESAEQKLRLAVETTCTSNDIIEKLKDALAEAWRIADASESRECVQRSHAETFSEPKYKHEVITGQDHDKYK